MKPLTESAEIIGKLNYAEMQLFSFLGQKSQIVETPRLSVFLFSASKAHGWRSRQLFDLLPVSVGLPGAEELTVGSTPDFDNAIRKSDDLESDGLLLEILATGLYPILLSSYQEILSNCSNPTDAALRRILYRIIGDLQSVTDEANRICSVFGWFSGFELSDSEKNAKETIVTLLRQFLSIAY